MSRSLVAIEDFNAWMESLPHRHKVLVPGNHEFFLEADERRRDLIPAAHILINETIEIEGLRLWGSPTTPMYGGAFGKSSAAARNVVFDMLPADIDILITHGPPLGILDTDLEIGKSLGCKALKDAINRGKPAVHVFGHVHSAYGAEQIDGTLFVNAALFETEEVPLRRPIVVDFTARRQSSRCKRTEKVAVGVLCL